MNLKVLFLLAVTASTSHSRSKVKSGQNPCAGKFSCHECIRTRSCAWCSDPDYETKKGRCYDPGTTRTNCGKEFVYNPDSQYTVIEDRPLSKGSKSEPSYETFNDDAVQISPQRVRLKLRINERYKIKIKYSQAEDYPVDLYYLMDLSNSMGDDKDNLSVLGYHLAQKMQNITTNFRLGFGSFVDKPVIPFLTSETDSKACSQCVDSKDPYGFRHRMPLSTNITRFTEEVKSSEVTRLNDAPEGGFDAVMQAVVCHEQIGWRQKARHLLVFSSDAEFHYAGDGKLGGIIKPNDGLCHLNKSGRYTHWAESDYPSVSQINYKVKQNAINVIFAVTENQLSIYKNLQKHIEGSSTGLLTKDSSNVVELVKEQYDKITSFVELKDNATDAVKVTYISKCLNPEGPPSKTNKCRGVKVGRVVEFEALVEVKSCPKKKSDWEQTFQIYPVGINESLIVSMEMLCDCPCENEGSFGYKENAEECNGLGTYQCGVCSCDPDRSGLNCECDESLEQKHESSGCRPDNTTKIDCSGRGECVCGKCVCDERPGDEVIDGAFCECDNFSCNRENGALCSGPGRGTCKCGSCICEPGWTGPSCSCRSEEACLPPGGGRLCSGKGQCVCGACICEEGLYSGRYCEKCLTCSGHCSELQECVECQVFESGFLSNKNCSDNCSVFIEDIVSTLVDEELKNEYICQYYDRNNCKFKFSYGFDEMGNIYVRAQRDKECPAQVYVLSIVMFVIGAIVFIGVAILLVWKLLTTIHDRREFAKFEKERKLAKWDTGENPLYKQATSTFKNPTYTGM